MAALAAALPLASYAQAPVEQGASFGIGVGVASSQKAYAGIDRETKVIPLLQYENQYIRVQGLGVEVKLPGLVISDTQRLNLSLVGRSAPAGYEASDAPILRGMAERKSSIWVGAKAEWKSSLANVSLDWTSDVSGHSKGQKLNVGVAHTWRAAPGLMITPRIGATWQDGKYNDYYYGVRSGEARAGRAAYRPGAGTSPEAGLTGVYMFNRHHSVMLGASVTGLPTAVKNSPLVDRSTENRVFMAYTYRF